MNYPSTKREVHYEWVVEWMDDYGDIQDLDHGDKLSYFAADDFETKYEGGSTAFALQRRAGCEADGLDVLGYAYVKDGVLPDEFDCSHKVPQRFKDQLRKDAKHDKIAALPTNGDCQ
jgi:hypothetical protein